MQIKVIGKTLLAIKNLETNIVSLNEFRTIELAKVYLSNFVKYNDQSKYFIVMSEKTERGPQRKKWGYAIKED